ncbi:unnamed protein product [Vicia faba]|uniref:Uncharacterized protein n=1 Tax=Vicia faba TaxID=3906 RepID=A0AAV0ZBJ5_VICFA|nr:unnamed protein product [Vicia faba]
MAFFMAIAGVFLVLYFCYGLLRWNEIRYRKKGLPPGTMGWPVFGETSKFLKQGPDFMKKQQARYGSFFKSHIFGCPTVICMDAELNRYILMNESKGLVAGYPQSMLDILGNSNIAAVHGPAHKFLRGALLSLVSPQMLRDIVLPRIDRFMSSQLSDWDGKIINLQDHTKEVIFLSILDQIASIDPRSKRADYFKTHFFKLVLGTLSLPINLPGTNYYNGVQARKDLLSMLRQILEERKALNETYKDMLSCLMKTDENKYKLNDDEILDLELTLMYSGYETVSTTSMMALKFLHDNPKALEEIRKEHVAIRERKKPNEPFNFDELKSMKFTRAVIMETSRLATVVNGVLRKTTHDVELNGYLIPKGWRIYVFTREINYDTSLYPDPLIFNPWRWMEKNLESHNYFLLFGGGTRLCPAKELGITEISTFLHYILTRYRWEEVGETKLEKFPRVQAPNGMHMRFSSY